MIKAIKCLNATGTLKESRVSAVSRFKYSDSADTGRPYNKNRSLKVI